MSSFGKFLLGTVIGVAVGTLLGMAYAPRSGDKTRQLLKDELENRYYDSLEKVGEAVDSVQAQAQEKINTVKSGADEISHRIQDSAETFKSRVKALSDELEETGRDTLNKLRGNNA